MVKSERTYDPTGFPGAFVTKSFKPSSTEASPMKKVKEAPFTSTFTNAEAKAPTSPVTAAVNTTRGLALSLYAMPTPMPAPIKDFAILAMKSKV